MYGYNEFVPLTVEEVFSRVTEKEVYEMIFEEDIIIDKEHKYRAPYRNDSHADCYFKEYEGRIEFVDFADIPRSKNCIEVVKRTYNIDYLEALEQINTFFKLGLGYSSNSFVKEVKKENFKLYSIVEESIKERTITLHPRLFNNKDKNFWGQYQISRENLVSDSVVPINIYQSTNRKGKLYSIKPFDIAYAYTEFENNKVKIYRPYGNKLEKWYTNCNQNDIGSLIHLPKKGNKLIISKSYKDCRVIRNQSVFSIWLQNEGSFPSKEKLIELCNRFEEVYIWFDNDRAGLSAGLFLKTYLESIEEIKSTIFHIYLPIPLLKEAISDPSDMLKLRGKDELLEFMSSKKLIR